MINLKEYLDHISHFILHEKFSDGSEPDEKIMRKVEIEWGVLEIAACDFRQDILAKMGAKYWIGDDPHAALIDFQKMVNEFVT